MDDEDKLNMPPISSDELKGAHTFPPGVYEFDKIVLTTKGVYR